MADVKIYKDDILAPSMNGNRQYQMVNNPNGTVSFVDVTEYEQVGDTFGAADVNEINESLNKFSNTEELDLNTLSDLVLGTLILNNGVVTIVGVYGGSALPSSVPIITIPSKYRPSVKKYGNATGDNNSIIKTSVDTDGALKHESTASRTNIAFNISYKL